MSTWNEDNQFVGNKVKGRISNTSVLRFTYLPDYRRIIHGYRCVSSVCIQSFSSLHLPAIGLKTDIYKGMATVNFGRREPNFGKRFNYHINVDCEATHRNEIEVEKAVKHMLKVSLSIKEFWWPLLLIIFKNPAGLRYGSSEI